MKRFRRIFAMLLSYRLDWALIHAFDRIRRRRRRGDKHAPVSMMRILRTRYACQMETCLRISRQIIRKKGAQTSWWRTRDFNVALVGAAHTSSACGQINCNELRRERVALLPSQPSTNKPCIFITVITIISVPSVERPLSSVYLVPGARAQSLSS